MAKHRLLLADDSVTIQKVVNLTFADEGIEVVSVGDGNSAMEKFVEATPDLVMVDVNMPGVDGYRICEMIKQDNETKHVPVILLVGSFEPFDEDEARRVGANDYLTKPFQSIRQLVNKVTVLLKNSNGAETSTQQAAEPQQVEPPVQSSAPEFSESLGNAGMDDEMIQADQIGSLPVADLSKLESNVSDFPTDSVSNQMDAPYSEQTNRQGYVSEENSGKTQPLSVEEFREITSIPGQVSDRYSDERVSAEEKVISLEDPMVSEFESGFRQLSADVEAESEQNFAPPISSEQTFSPEEIPSEDQVILEEIASERSFSIEDLTRRTASSEIEEATPYYDVSSQNEDVSEETGKTRDYETTNLGQEEFYNAPAESGIGENFETKQSEPSIREESNLIQEPQPETGASEETSNLHRGFFTRETTIEEISASEDEAIKEPEIIDARATEFDNRSEREESAEFAQNQPEYAEDQQSYPSYPSYPIEDYAQSDQGFSDVEGEDKSQKFTDTERDYAEPVNQTNYEDAAVSAQNFEPEKSETDQSDTSQDDSRLEQYLDVEAETSEAEIERNVAPSAETPEVEPQIEAQSPTFMQTEDATPTIEIPPATPTIEEMSPMNAEEEPLEIEPKEETTRTKVNKMVSSGGMQLKTDAVESVIVSEFARQSITLSAEAVETIAARIAERISEKLVEQLAGEVVANLADQIVEKMERKKLE